MEKNDLLEVVSDIVAEFGHAVYLNQGHVGRNDQSYATYETLINVMSNDAKVFPVEELRAQIAAQIDQYRVVGFTRNYNGMTKQFELKLTDPVFTYRDVMVNDANGKTLFSVSIGFPFVASE